MQDEDTADYDVGWTDLPQPSDNSTTVLRHIVLSCLWFFRRVAGLLQTLLLAASLSCIFFKDTMQYNKILSENTYSIGIVVTLQSAMRKKRKTDKSSV